MSGRLDEREEAWALRLAANGQGGWPLEGHPRYDEVYVSHPLESVDELHIFLRRSGRTLRHYRFRMVPVRVESPGPKGRT